MAPRFPALEVPGPFPPLSSLPCCPNPCSPFPPLAIWKKVRSHMTLFKTLQWLPSYPEQNPDSSQDPWPQLRRLRVCSLFILRFDLSATSSERLPGCPAVCLSAPCHHLPVFASPLISHLPDRQQTGRLYICFILCRKLGSSLLPGRQWVLNKCSMKE